MIESVAGPSALPIRQSTPRQSGALPEAPSAFDIANQIQEVQVENLKRTLDAQTLVLDLLV